MTLKEYEELYCTYCDSRRCVNVGGNSIPETCPYWEVRMKAEEMKNREFAAMGWVCPKCGAVMSPYQRFCIKCSGNSEFIYDTGTKPSNWETVYTGFRTEEEFK